MLSRWTEAPTFMASTWRSARTRGRMAPRSTASPPISKRNGPRSRSAAGGRGAATSPRSPATCSRVEHGGVVGVARRRHERHPKGVLLPEVIEPARRLGLDPRVVARRQAPRSPPGQGPRRRVPGSGAARRARQPASSSACAACRASRAVRPGLQDWSTKSDRGARRRGHRHPESEAPAGRRGSAPPRPRPPHALARAARATPHASPPGSPPPPVARPRGGGQVVHSAPAASGPRVPATPSPGPRPRRRRR